jgi:hypothetical protein
MSEVMKMGDEWFTRCLRCLKLLGPYKYWYTAYDHWLCPGCDAVETDRLKRWEIQSRRELREGEV